jgi:hypothetical protein
MESFRSVAEIRTLTDSCKPVSSLSAIIDSYNFRSISLDKGLTLSKYMPCRHSNSIDFFIGDCYDTVDLNSGDKVPFVHCTIRGPRTFKKYSIELKGNFMCFSIRFKPTGIYQFFGIPMEYFCNSAVDTTLVNQ